MPKYLQTILLLLASNTFMTIAWYGHLKFKGINLFTTILISWGIAFIEYSLMIPANKIGSSINDGPFNMWQLKMIQEVISITVFIFFTLIIFKGDSFRLNHIIGFLCLLAAVYFFFKK